MLTALALAAGVVTPAAAETVVPLQGPTAVREYAGIALLSAFDPATDTYRLATVSDGVLTPVPGVAPAGAAFDADIGPGANGRPQIVFSTDSGGQRDLFVVSLPGGAVRPVSNANTRSNEVAPTLWRGRIAFTRLYGPDRDPQRSGVQRDPVVYTKRLVAPRSTPSTRLPGVPRRRCGDDGTTCGPTEFPFVAEMELYGSRLAQSVFYTCDTCAGIAQNEVRLVDADTRRAEQIAFQVTGLSGQSYQGLSFVGRRLAFYKSCGGDTSGCNGGKRGPRSFRLPNGPFEGALGPAEIGGFALVDGDNRAFVVLDCGSGGGPSGPSCRLERTDRMTFAPLERPLRD